MPVRLTPKPAPLEMMRILPCARLLHARRNGLRADESPLEIHVKDGLPLIQGDGFQWLPRLSDGAAGAVDENVHPAAA